MHKFRSGLLFSDFLVLYFNRSFNPALFLVCAKNSERKVNKEDHLMEKKNIHSTDSCTHSNSVEVTQDTSTFRIIDKENDLDLHESFLKPRLPDRDTKQHDVFGRRKHCDPILPSKSGNSNPFPRSKLHHDEEYEYFSLIYSKNMKKALYSTTHSNDGATRRSAVAPLTIKVLNSVKNSSESDYSNFSTTMTVREAASILETLCREILCDVKRIDSTWNCVKLKVIRPGPRWGLPSSRRAKACIIIRERDKLITDISISCLSGLKCFEKSSSISLSNDIKWRFQREWPIYVDSLYARVPG